MGIGGDIIYKVFNPVTVMGCDTQFFPFDLSGGLDCLMTTVFLFFPVGGGDTVSVSTLSGVLGVLLRGCIGVLVVGEGTGASDGVASKFMGARLRRAMRISWFCCIMLFSTWVWVVSSSVREGWAAMLQRRAVCSVRRVMIL